MSLGPELERDALQRRAVLWMLLSAAATAVMGALVFGLRSRCDWRLVLLARGFVGLVVAAAVVRLRGVRPIVLGPGPLWVRSISGCIGVGCTYYALSSLPTADALTLMGTAPVWIILLGFVLRGHRPRAVELVVVAVCFLGVVLVEQPHLAQGNFGVLAALGTGLSVAISVLAIQRIRHVDPRVIVLHYSGAVVLVAGLWVGLSWRHLALRTPLTDVVTLAMLAGVGVLATVALLASTHAYNLASAPRVSAVAYAKVGLAALLDFALFGHVPGPSAAVGITLVLGALLLLVVTRRPARLGREGRVVITEGGAAAATGRGGRIGEDVLRQLEEHIAEAERRTSCEFRVHLEPRSPSGAWDRAAALFETLGMGRTRLRNGVLIYLGVESGELAVIVDDGIAEVAPAGALDEMRHALERGFAKGDAVAAVRAGLDVGAARLAGYFRHTADDVNELPDAVSLGEGM